MFGTTARESNAGPRDEEGKTMMNSDEEEKPNDASEEQNPMPSNPPMPAADTERSSDKMAMQPSGSEEDEVDSPLKKIKNEPFTETHDQTHSDVVPESGSIQSSNTEGAPSSTQPIKTSTGGFTRRIFLFEIRLTSNDIEQGNLFIPVEIALDHFPRLPRHRQRNYEQKIKISDAETHRDWSMTLRYDPDECVFLIKSGWQGFAQLHNLKATDSIRFYKPIPHSHDNHFLIEHIKSRNQEAHHEITVVPEFKPENFLFRRELSENEIKFERLILPTKDVRNHFPAVRIPAETHNMERLYFTDAYNQDWCMNIVFNFQTYLVIKGWEGFVNSYPVEAGDEIRFYKPVRPWNSRHFLIEHVKRDEAGTSGTTGNDGNGDDVSLLHIIEGISGGNNQEGGGGGRSSGGGSPKGKKFAAGNCCMS